MTSTHDSAPGLASILGRPGAHWLDEYETLKADATPTPWCAFGGELRAGITAEQMSQYDVLAAQGAHVHLGADAVPAGEKLFLGDAKRASDARLIEWLRAHGDELVAAARVLRELVNRPVSHSAADSPCSGRTSGRGEQPPG